MGEPDRHDLLALLDLLPVGVAIFRPRRLADGTIEDLVIEYANPVVRAMVDLPEIVGGGLAEQIPENRTTGILDRYIRVVETGVEHRERLELRGVAVDGLFDVHARPLGDDGLLLQVVDVTDQVAAADAERAAHQRIAETLDRINDAVFSLDRDFHFTYVNPEAARVLGRQPEELLGESIWEQYPAAVGSEFERCYRHAMATGETMTFEAYYPEPLDSWYSVRTYPGPEGLTVYFQDVGVRHRVEERAADLGRLESTAMLAGGVAHDFNNLLMVISGHATLLADDLPGDHPAQPDLAVIRRAAEEAAELSHQLLALGRVQDPRPTLVDLNSVLEHLGPRLRPSLPASVHLEVHPAGEPVLVDVDPDELQRSLLHLAANAAHAMPGGGRLTIGVSSAVVEPAPAGSAGSVGAGSVDAGAAAHPERAPGPYGVLTVADTGIGMPEEVLRRAAQPFFSTRRSLGATGLGLSAVHAMALQAGGHVAITSAPGAGTTVELHLPRANPDR